VKKPRYILDAEEEAQRTSSPSESSRAASPISVIKRGRKPGRTPAGGTGRKRGSVTGSGTSTPVNNPRGSRASSVSSSTVKKSRKKIRGERSSFASPLVSGRRGGRGGASRGGKAGGRGYNPNLVNYKDSEYHYGSDFEDNEDVAGLGADSGAETSDSEDSDLESRLSDDMKPESDVELEPVLLEETCGTVVAPLPFWLQEAADSGGESGGVIPELHLPESSADLVIESRTLLLEAVSIYEVLRQFYSIIRLSPFRLEDFCVVLQNEEEQSGLLSEIHISLLKTLLREDEQQQVQFGPLDQKDSINVLLYVVDPVTWPENLRFYLSADPTAPGHTEALTVLTTTEYPFTSVENRLCVLRTLTDAFLNTAALRDVLQNEGQLPLEDHCRVCHRLGDMVCL
jgi:nucleosome-remodeling factor subunit BPTF